MIVTSRPSLRTQIHLSQAGELSKFDGGTCTGGAAAKGVGVPMFEERAGVRIHEACEPPEGVSGAVRPMVVVPARHLALVLRATHVRGDAEDGLVDVAVTEAAASSAWAVLGLVVGLQFEAFITECWLSRRRPLVRVVEGDVVLVRRALCSSDCGHAAATNGGRSGRLRVDVIKDSSG